MYKEKKPMTTKARRDLSKAPVSDLAKMIKNNKKTLDEIPFKRRAQLVAYLKKEAKKVDLSKETVERIQEFVEEGVKDIGEIPSQRRVQVTRKMELDEEARLIQEANPD